MNKEALISTIAEKLNSNKTEVKRFLEGYIETVTDALKKGEAIQLVGFGTLSVYERKARTGQNPRTREKIEIPASKAIKFTVGKLLKDEINSVK